MQEDVGHELGTGRLPELTQDEAVDDADAHSGMTHRPSTSRVIALSTRPAGPRTDRTQPPVSTQASSFGCVRPTTRRGTGARTRQA
jgi:hypothetical protein